ncbi:MAG: hypothetical protein LQ351_004356 [Letrouitia transgressa]|nr:MAG: hypothetical protein LQ351_004356 [Letrouitia transgressa]
MASTLRSLLRRPPSSSSSKLHPLALPPAFLLPRFARLSTTVNTTNPEPLPAAFKPAQRPPNASKLQQAPRSQRPQALSPSPLEASNTPSQPQSVSDSPISETAAAAEPHHQSPPFPPPAQLHLLATQPPHYINVLIHGKHYLLTEGDVLRLPFKMPDATVGSVLRLTRASMLGSRDYTYRGDPVIDERYVRPFPKRKFQSMIGVALSPTKRGS